jgi:hypothetical protein
LTDRLNKTEPVFSRKVNSFQEAYPTVASLRAEVSESEIGLGGSRGSWTFTEHNFQHAVNCSNSVCYGGGVELGWILHDMVRSRKTEHEETKMCQGYEGSPKGRRRYRRCLNTFHIKIHVVYRDDEESEKTESTQSAPRD